jgi:type IV pilus assembly protein PilB
MDEMSNENRNALTGYANYIAERGLLDKQIALDALLKANTNKQSYIEYLIKQKLLNDTQVAQATSEYFGLPLFDIDAFDLKLSPPEYLNIQLVKRRLALPLFKKNGLVYLAIVDPTAENLYEIKFLTGFDIRLLIVEANKLSDIVDEMLNALILSEINTTGDSAVKAIEVNAYKEDTTDVTSYEVASAPIINYVNKILLDAINKNISDIHFECYENNYRIRYRQHGVLYPITAPPLKLANYILARIKVMSDLDITEHRIPQDGRFKLIIPPKKSVDFRVSVCPTLFGEKTVLRILDTSATLQDVKKLGMTTTQEAHFMSALQRTQGFILVTGPTGSGKTVSLYSALHYLNSPEKNISTAEDPVEIPMHGINQVHINPKTGLNFSTVLRAFLRQDPDIIMVGEIRDLETAEIAIKASQTGHLVLSTLHTNSAPETVNRLLSMGIKPYNLASSLTIVIAQRLVRTLCDKCKTKEELPKDILLKEGFKEDELEKLIPYAPVGCDKCLHGFNGRTGIFEVMPVSEEMSEIIMKNGNVLDISTQAKKENVSTLRESGLEKIRQGITCLTELNRVFK